MQEASIVNLRRIPAGRILAHSQAQGISLVPSKWRLLNGTLLGPDDARSEGA